MEEHNIHIRLTAEMENCEVLVHTHSQNENDFLPMIMVYYYTLLTLSQNLRLFAALGAKS
jgi:hypothetical protein